MTDMIKKHLTIQAQAVSAQAAPRGAKDYWPHFHFTKHLLLCHIVRRRFELWMQGFREFFWIFWTGSKPQLKR